MILGRMRRVFTGDVSRHGLFVETQDAVRERFLVQTTIHLPDGPLSATAYVSRRVGPESPQQGLGLQLFAISLGAKERWDRFIKSLSGDEPAQPAQRGPDTASFLVKLPTLARLREFQLKTLPTGSIYLATPVLRAIGTPVAVVFIHPLTEAEFALAGTVVRVHTKTRRGMEIRLRTITDADWKAFYRFVESGQAQESHEPPRGTTPSRAAPGATPRPSVSPARPSVPVTGTTPKPSIPPIGNTPKPAIARPPAKEEPLPKPRKVRADSHIEDTDRLPIPEPVVEQESARPARAAIAEPTSSDDLQIDIDVAELSEQHQFSWTDVEDELVIDLDLSQYEADPSAFTPIAPERAFDDFLAALGPDRNKIEAKLKKRSRLKVRCSGECKLEAVVPFGDAEGFLGLLARYRPFWSPEAKEIVTLARTKRPVERTLEAIPESARRSALTVEVLVAMHRALQPPKDPKSDAALVRNAAIRALERAAGEMKPDETRTLAEPCPACGSGRWSLSSAGD